MVMVFIVRDVNMPKLDKILKSQRAFTMIEITLVIVLSSIILASTYMLKFSSTKEVEFEAQFTQLLSDIRYAHELSMTGHINCGIFINNAGTYTIYENGNTADPAFNPADFTDFIINLPGGITIATTANGSKIEFDNFGTPSDGGGLLAADQFVVLTDSAGTTTRTVRVSPNTGLVRIQ